MKYDLLAFNMVVVLSGNPLPPPVPELIEYKYELSKCMIIRHLI